MINVKINQDTWVVSVLDKKEYEAKHVDTKGLTDSEHKTIDLHKDYFSELLVRHELTHAFYYSIIDKYTPDDLDKDQIEEIFCTLFEYHGTEILTTAKEVYKILNERITNESKIIE